jgi:cellulose synthase/poly-beta-1,6-N-acetylglucosamine synthase-like glycosyltransferase
MEILPFIYLGYMFISLYFLSMFLIIYLKNRKTIFDYPKPKEHFPVSFIVPAYNEGDSIADCIEHIFKSYDNILEVIIINDCSTDNTRQIVEKLKKKYPKIKLINNKKNLGNAAKAQNLGLKYAKADFVVVVDADSFPIKNSIEKMIGFFNDKKVGAVTCPVIARNTSGFIEKLQAIEYKMISLTRKLLDYVDSIYVTPGPLAVYRKKALLEIGGFDENNMTQDIEATWHLTFAGWDRRMCLATHVLSKAPSKFKAWFIQRRRWNVGGLQCIAKYKKSLLDPKRGMLGFFIIPFFVLSTFLGLLGLSIFSYLATRRIISNFLRTKYSIISGTPVLTAQDVFITPSVLNYLGVALLILGFIFLLIVFAVLKEKVFRRDNLLNIPFYLIIYIAVYPFVMISALIHMVRGKRVWR